MKNKRNNEEFKHQTNECFPRPRKLDPNRTAGMLIKRAFNHESNLRLVGAKDHKNENYKNEGKLELNEGWLFSQLEIILVSLKEGGEPLAEILAEHNIAAPLLDYILRNYVVFSAEGGAPKRLDLESQRKPWLVWARKELKKGVPMSTIICALRKKSEFARWKSDKTFEGRLRRQYV